ncbi:hypothetical protein [Actinomadura sp. WMMA1423]|uniref:hypothetical protein n=1 Tax=Actinomadura sp. WMMA1423 TaxID=2591108 RepID=UPI0011465B03|nr:hypothetical protein [Actinomadura sp. WMMA1423]
MSSDQEKQQLADLTTAHPGWSIQHLPEANLPWEARRLPFQLPASGGYMWLNAPTAARLADLIDGALQFEAQLATEDAANARLEALRLRAVAAGFRAELEQGVLTVTAPPADDGPRGSEMVTCRSRLEDNGRLWFFDGDGAPIEQADHVTDAVVILGGKLWRIRS